CRQANCYSSSSEITPSAREDCANHVQIISPKPARLSSGARHQAESHALSSVNSHHALTMALAPAAESSSLMSCQTIQRLNINFNNGSSTAASSTACSTRVAAASTARSTRAAASSKPTQLHQPHHLGLINHTAAAASSSPRSS
ncbi:hypothetical protein PV325_008331, partial [Microctonus aethiopoides]